MPFLFCGGFLRTLSHEKIRLGCSSENLFKLSAEIVQKTATSNYLEKRNG